MATVGNMVAVLTARTGGFTKGMGRARKSVGRFRGAVTSLMATMAPFVTVMAGIYGAIKGAKIGAAFEHEMARVKALTGATGESFQALSALAQELGATTEHTAGQAAEAMGAFALAGFKTNQILASMAPTLNLASAGQLEVGQAADIAAKLMAGMGLSADQLGGAVDVMAKAFTTANRCSARPWPTWDPSGGRRARTSTSWWPPSRCSPMPASRARRQARDYA